ncbi:MAG: GNAT family protein [Verrucomicrobia bacterium]|nr:GNAT family protein [Verrucomicrobiota bacterium]
MFLILGDVVLRKPEPKDVDFLYQIRNDYEVTRSLGGFSSGYSRQDLNEWVEDHRKKHDELLWTIARKENDECLGHVGLYHIDPRVRCCEFAILIGKRQEWGKGLGTRVTQAVLDFGFIHLNLQRIYLYVLCSNLRAIAVYRKLGFQEEGVLRRHQYRDGEYQDVMVMGLLEDEWQAVKQQEK